VVLKRKEKKLLLLFFGVFFIALQVMTKGVSSWDGMQSLQPNENTSKDLWIRFLEGDWQRDFGRQRDEMRRRTRGRLRK